MSIPTTLDKAKTTFPSLIVIVPRALFKETRYLNGTPFQGSWNQFRLSLLLNTNWSTTFSSLKVFISFLVFTRLAYKLLLIFTRSVTDLYLRYRDLNGNKSSDFFEPSLAFANFKYCNVIHYFALPKYNTYIHTYIGRLVNLCGHRMLKMKWIMLF